MNGQYILTITCADRVGVVAAVSGFLAERGIFIQESSHFGDLETGRFFMRTVFSLDANLPSVERIRDSFAAIAERFAMEWNLYDANRRQRAIILVSRLDHCLNDLLYRHRTGTLKMDLKAVVSNHLDLAGLVEWHGIPFHHLPVTPETRMRQEGELVRRIEETEAELIILARYMQIFSPPLCARLKGRAINIHHSFLPGFKGVKPYHQAHTRGVKLIGATAHYVTENLDEGPIIEQAVERVDHAYSPDKLIAVGRDIENVVLARAVRFHLEHRVLIDNGKTVVLR
jgi:formyltetrahydrofolate deformylase